MSKDPTPYAEALARARSLVAALGPACERVLIAGSLRRKKAMVGDLELVVIPNVRPVIDMFGSPAGTESLLDLALIGLGLSYTKNGPKFKQFAWEGMSCDLFICTPETWAVNATLRTGCADFSQWLVTPRQQGGAKPGHLDFRDGQLLSAGRPLDVATEEELFQAMDIRWLPPEARTPERTATLWRR